MKNYFKDISYCSSTTKSKTDAYKRTMRKVQLTNNVFSWWNYSWRLVLCIQIVPKCGGKIYGKFMGCPIWDLRILLSQEKTLPSPFQKSEQVLALPLFSKAKKRVSLPPSFKSGKKFMPPFSTLSSLICSASHYLISRNEWNGLWMISCNGSVKCERLLLCGKARFRR